MSYDPELDTSPKLDSDSASYYLTVIGILRWMIELRRISFIKSLKKLHVN